MASLLQPGSRDPGYFQALLATGSPDVQWATSSNYASQGLGPVKQLLFEPLSVHTVPPLETTPQNWLQLEKHPAASYRADVAATPLSQIQSRNPSLECGWSLQDGSFSQAQCYTPARQHLVAPKTGVATNPEDRRPIWQHAGSHVQPAAFQGSNLGKSMFCLLLNSDVRCTECYTDPLLGLKDQTARIFLTQHALNEMVFRHPCRAVRACTSL